MPTDPAEELVELPADPNAIVGVRLGDVQELEARCGAAEASLEDARRDLVEIIGVLNCAPAEEITPHELVQHYILPRCRMLMATQGVVDSYQDELREMSRSGAPTIDVAPGVKAVRAGKRLQAGTRIDQRAVRGQVRQKRGE